MNGNLVTYDWETTPWMSLGLPNNGDPSLLFGPRESPISGKNTNPRSGYRTTGIRSEGDIFLYFTWVGNLYGYGAAPSTVTVELAVRGWAGVDTVGGTLEEVALENSLAQLFEYYKSATDRSEGVATYSRIIKTLPVKNGKAHLSWSVKASAVGEVGLYVPPSSTPDREFVNVSHDFILTQILEENRNFPRSPYDGNCPLDPSGCGPFDALMGGLREGTCGVGPTAGDPVNLATRTETYEPGPDLFVDNPVGPSVDWRRQWKTNRSRERSGSPGLATGWVHNYDITIQGYLETAAIPDVPGTGPTSSNSYLDLVFPTGARDRILDGVPGTLTVPLNRPYVVSGDKDGSGDWTRFTVTWRDNGAKWVFEKVPGSGYAGGASMSRLYKLVRIFNSTGQAIHFSYSPKSGYLSTVRNDAHVTLLTLSYDGPVGLLSQATDCYSRKVVYSGSAYGGWNYTLLNTVSHVVASSEMSPATRFSYGTAAGTGYYDLSSITVPSPTGTGTSTATLTYDGSGKVTRRTDGNGNYTTYEDGWGGGNTIVRTYNSSNVLTREWIQYYDSANRSTGVKIGSNARSTIVYDTNHPWKKSSITYPDGLTESFTYDARANVTSHTDVRGITTSYTWSYGDPQGLGRLTQIQVGSLAPVAFTYYEPSGLLESVTTVSPTGSGTVTTSYTYDALGNVLTIVAPANSSHGLSRTTTFNYTSDGGYSQSAALGQPLRITSPEGYTAHLRYDSQGRVISSKDGQGNEAFFTYNLLGQTLTESYPATRQTGPGRSGVKNTYLYPGGPLLSSSAVDESGATVRTVNYAYGKEGEVLSVTGSTEPVAYTYDGAYRLKTLRDGRSNATTYSYDGNSNLTRVDYPGGDYVRFTSFDAVGRVLQRIDGNGVVTNYTYSGPGKALSAIQYPSTPTLNVSISYDSYARPSSRVDGSGTESYGYDDLGNLLSVTTTYAGLPAKTVSYSYYADGSRATMTTPAGGYGYAYNKAGQLAILTNPFGEAAIWGYDWKNGRLISQSVSNGLHTAYQHNALGQLQRMINVHELGQTFSDYSQMNYDGVGNRLRVTADLPAMPGYSGLTQYQYNTKDELTQENSARSGSYVNSFSYDAAGNPTSFKGASRSYNANNQLTTGSFVYDGNGNPTTYAGTAMTYDPENRLTSVGTVMTAGYRADGLRAWKETSAGRTYFLYDGYDIVCELDNAGNVTAANTWGANGLISRRAGGNSTFYTFDERGTTSQRHDASGNVITSHMADAFGTFASSSATTDPYAGFGSQWGYYKDWETGFQLLGHRYYDAGTGRFVTRDPIGYEGGINLYGYVGNSPTGWIDPDGLKRKRDFSGLIALGGIAVVADGPLPVGDAVAAGIGIYMGSVLLYDYLTQPRRPQTLTFPSAPRNCGPTLNKEERKRIEDLMRRIGLPKEHYPKVRDRIHKDKIPKGNRKNPDWEWDDIIDIIDEIAEGLGF